METTHTVQRSLTGSWKLVTYEQSHPDGTVTYPQGHQPVGRIVYDRAGRVSAHLMRQQQTGEEILVQGFIAYHGTYALDERTQTVTHHIESCLLPGWAGTAQQRRYQLDGNRLILRAQRKDSEVRLTWEREAA